MKKETLCGLLLLFLCSGFWVLTLMLAASFLGLGFAQVPQQQTPYVVSAIPLPFGEPSQPGMQQMPPMGPPMGMSQPQPYMGMPLLNNNAMLPNQGQATYNMATQEVKIPFEVDTSRLLAFSVVVDNNVQTTIIVDPINQSMVVYNVYLNGPNMGKIELKSARNISADLKLFDYDSMGLSPRKVQAFIEQ